MPKHKSKSDELKNRVEELFSAGLTGMDQVGEMDLYGESIFRTAFENSAVAMCLTGTDGHFMLVNRAFADILGYSQDEMAGKSFQALTHPEDVSVGGDAMKAMLSGASSTALIQKRYLHKEGQVVWAELNIALIRDQENKPQYFVSIVRNISEQKSTATMLDKRVRELDCLNDIGHKIDEQTPLADFLAWVTERIPAAMLYPEECIVAIDYKGDVYGNAEARDQASKVVGGIRVGGELLGWLHIAYTKSHSFIDAESALLGGIVSRISSYIQMLQQQQDTERRTRELIILNEMALALTSVLDLNALVETVYQYSAKLTDVTNFFLALYDPETEMVSFPVAYSDGQRTEINTRPLGNALTDYIIRNGKPLLLTDNVVQRAEEKGIKLMLYGKPVPAESWLGVPVMHGNQVQGVIAVQSITTPGLFREYDQEVLTNIARSVGNTLTLTRLYEQAQTALDRVKGEQDRFRAIYEGSNDAIMLLDEKGFFDCNERTLELFGFSAVDEFTKVTPADVSPPLQPDGSDSVSAAMERIQTAYKVGNNRFDWVHRRTNGEDFPAEVLLSAFTLDDRRVLQATVRDVTERQQAEQAIGKRANELAKVAEIGTIAATVLDPTELLQKAIDLIKDGFGLYHAHIYLLNSTGDALDLAVGAGEGGRKMVSKGWKIGLESERSLVARTARQREGTIANDVRAEPDFLPNELLPDTASEMAVPLLAGEQLLGVLDVQATQVEYFTSTDVSIMETLGAQIAVALRNAQLYSHTQSALAESDALYQGSSRIATAKSADEVLQALVASTALSQLDRANILLFSQPWGEVAPEFVTVSAVWEKQGLVSVEPAGTVYPLSQFPGFQLLDRSGPVIFSDVLKYKSVDKRLIEGLQNMGIHSLVAWPLKAGDEWFASVTGQSAEVFHLNDVEMRRIDSLMNQSASVLQNLRLIERTRSRIQREQSLREITTQVRGLMEPDVILRTAVRELGTVLGRKTYILLGQSADGAPDTLTGATEEQEPKDIGE